MATEETDYLIVGAGAVGLAFADTLIDEDPNCHITFVDKHAKPGGHWNDAYSFVALHQPSAFYGVNSMEFPSEHMDTHGPNAGFSALASGPEISAYFEKVMNMRLLPTGRVAYHRLTEFKGRDEDGVAHVTSILSGEKTSIKVRGKIVDATFYQTSVPSTHKRSFSVADNVQVVAPGELPDLWKVPDDLPEHYVVLGAGKTAMDAGIWLLGAGVDPANITWVRPRESWLWNRAYVQPGADFFEAVIGNQIAHLKAAEIAQDGVELMQMLGESGHCLRIDETLEPEMFHFAVISQGEIDQLRTIANVVRKGRVSAITPGEMHLQEGTHQVPENTLFIDCTARAVPFSVQADGKRPLFEDGLITLQPLHVPLVTLSAAVTAFIETHFDSDEERNRLAIPGPLTDTPAAYPHAFATTMLNRSNWSQNAKIAPFLAKSRLDPSGPTMAKMAAAGDTRLAIMGQFGLAAAKATPNLRKLAAKAREIHENG